MTVEWAWAGAVTPSSAWVRGKVDGDSVRLAADTDPAFGNPTWFGPTAPGAHHVASVRADGLTEDTRYYWALEVDGQLDTTKTGTFRTFPPEGEPASFVFGAASCAGANSDYDPLEAGVSNHPVFDAIRDAAPAFFLHMGDLWYRDNLGADVDAYRECYDLLHQMDRQAACWRSMAFAWVWDNHDSFGSSDVDRTHEGREAAQQAFRECFPYYPLPHPEGIQQTFTYGRCRFILLDTPSFRDPSATGEDFPGKTMLGADQKQWLLDTVADAEERVIFLMTAVPWIAGGEGDLGGSRNWRNYAGEREEIAQALVATGKSHRLIFLAGDAHMLAADDGRNNTYGGLHRPVLQAAAMDSPASPKGGPYSAGHVQTTGDRGMWGRITVTDRGGDLPIRVHFSGRRLTI